MMSHGKTPCSDEALLVPKLAACTLLLRLRGLLLDADNIHECINQLGNQARGITNESIHKSAHNSPVLRCCLQAEPSEEFYTEVTVHVPFVLQPPDHLHTVLVLLLHVIFGGRIWGANEQVRFAWSFRRRGVGAREW